MPAWCQNFVTIVGLALYTQIHGYKDKIQAVCTAMFHVSGEEDWKEFTWNFDSCDMPLFLEKL